MFERMRAEPGIGICLLVTLWSAALIGCRRAEPEERRVEDLDDVLAAVPDSAMRQRWREAEAAGRLPPLESLRIPTNPIETRRPVTVDTTRPTPPNAQIPQGAVADVRAIMTPALSDYDGRATLEEFGAARLVVRLADTVPGAAPGRLEIHYKLPAGATLIQLPAAAPLSLSYHETVEDGSQRRVVALAQERAPLLVRVSAGDRRPYARAFPGLQLAVRQNAPAADGISTVTITHAGRALTLRPGERQRSRDARGEVEIFLESSYWTPPAQVQLAEGDPYHVRLMVYRIAPTSPG